MPDIIVPEWFLRRLQAVCNQDPHDKELYHAMNTLLTAYFPAVNQFIVDPRARLPSKPWIPTSYGQTESTHGDDLNPDYLVSLGSAQLDQDVPILICDVKWEGKAAEDSTVQLERYIAWGRQYQAQLSQPQAWRLSILLVRGATTELYTLDPDGSAIRSLHETTVTELLGILQSLHDQHAAL